MKSIANISNLPTSIPLSADSVTEFHASRLILLFYICGTNSRINGLTKMAKLDFFVRYPKFFSKVCVYLGEEAPLVSETVESNMVRFHYGPWDQRYYHILAYLESRELINIEKKGKSINLALTKTGKSVAKKLSKEDSFEKLIEQMGLVKGVLGSKRGTQLKNLIYEVFDEEVAQLSLQEVIE